MSEEGVRTSSGCSGSEGMSFGALVPSVEEDAPPEFAVGSAGAIAGGSPSVSSSASSAAPSSLGAIAGTAGAAATVGGSSAMGTAEAGGAGTGGAGTGAAAAELFAAGLALDPASAFDFAFEFAGGGTPGMPPGGIDFF